MFLNLFGKKKNIDTKNDTVQVIFNLKETLALQTKKEEFIEKNIEKLRKEAQQFLKENKKQKAINHLKLCKMKEKNLSHLYGIKANLESQIFALEQAMNNEVLIKSIKGGKNALDNFRKTYDADNTAELMDDINENLEISNEISDILSKPVGNIYDEDELLNELKEEEDLSLMLEVPKIKVTVKKQVINEEEEDLRQLEKEFAFPEVPSMPIKIKKDAEII
jgi:charged multivesicular body protein 4